MGNGQINGMVPQKEQAFTEQWFSEEIDLAVGMYQLMYDGQWHCLLAGDECARILNCAAEAFWETFLALPVLVSYNEPVVAVDTVLQEVATSRQSCAFISVCSRTDGAIQYIKGTMTVTFDRTGQMYVLGQLVDVTDLRERDVHAQITEDELHVIMSQMGKHISYYDIATSTMTTSPTTAQKLGIPRVMENYPECFVHNPTPGYAREDLDKLMPFFEAIRRGDPTGSYDYSVTTSDGKNIRLHREFHTIFDDRGNPVRAVLSSEDVTEQYEQVAREFALERSGLLQAAQAAFQEIVNINLSKQSYRMVRHFDKDHKELLLEGELAQILERRMSCAAPEHQQAFRDAFFPENLMKAVNEGKKQVQLTHLRREEEGESYHWVETTLMRQDNPYDDDILLVAVSRNVDEEKEQELHLEELIRQREEELRITMSQMGKHISCYDIATSTLSVSPATAEQFGMPTVLENYPECYLENPPAGYPSEEIEKLRRLFEAVRRGDSSGSYEYSYISPEGTTVWMQREFHTIFDEQGHPVRAVLATSDVSSQYKHLQQTETDYRGLIQITQLMFPQILSCNLTQNTCEVIQRAQDTPQTMDLDAFLNIVLTEIFPEDQDAFRLQFFRENQLKAIAEGRQRFQLIYRRKNAVGGWNWVETTALYHVSPYNNDILTFAVSRNADQQKLQEEKLQAALSASIDKFDGWNYYTRLSNHTYDGLTYVRYLDERPSPYVVGGLARRLDCPEKELVLGTCFRIPNSDEKVVQEAFEQGRQSNEKRIQADYRIVTDRGETVWVHNQAVQFTDKSGDTGYIHFLTDITRERELLDQLKARMEAELERAQELFKIVALHSNRVLYAYDLATGVTRPWNAENAGKDILQHLYLGNYSDHALDENSAVLPESTENVKRFFSEIHGGVPFSELKLHVRLDDGALRWYQFYSSSIFTDGKPVTALISVEDITESYEREIAYRQHVQAVTEHRENSLLYLEACLICQRVENLSGQLPIDPDVNVAEIPYSQFGTRFLAPHFRFDDGEESGNYFAIEHLLSAYQRGDRKLYRTWKVFFHDGTTHWLDSEVIMLPDPYNDHVKAFIRLSDNTEYYQAQQTLLEHANNDAMTGLLRRGVGEARIQEYLSSHTEPGGILLALDLDDLKGINDNFGHQCGDRAIKGIAELLKGHFRKDDILIRAGGDEFIIFLPGAAKGVSSVELSLSTLLRKLATISIGDDGRRTIHCSIGCAVELPETDTFESLYQRADMALYHVKRSGKNNFAFFEPAMLEENYRLKLKQATPVTVGAAKPTALKGLLEVISVEYPGVVQFNLTQDYFQIMSVGNNYDGEVHDPDRADVFWENWRENIHPDDVDGVFSTLTRTALLSVYARGQRRFSHCYRNKESAGYVRTKVDVRFYSEESGDVVAFLFFRWDTGDTEKDVEVRRLRKLLEMTDTRSFEYVCLIDVRSKEYSIFRNDGENSHLVPEIADFDTATRHIRDTQIPIEEQDAYYENAVLSSVLARMQNGDEKYSYRYTMLDGITREAVFGWYEDNHAELLMTVRKI